MKEENSRARKALTGLAVTALVASIALATASCGSGAKSTSSTQSSSKLPPGASDSGTSSATSSSASSEAGAGTDTSSSTATTGGTASGSAYTTPASDSTGSQNNSRTTKTAYLSGANFTVVSVARENSNSTVAGGTVRELAGDFLYVELTVTNISDDLVDLSDFSFRLWNPAIDAGLYEEYYGSDGTYGGYVSANMISASLLDLETLQTISYKLRIGETAEDAFLFFDLNPLSTAKNEGVTLDGTNLVIYDTETGNKAEINLSGFTG